MRAKRAFVAVFVGIASTLPLAVSVVGEGPRTATAQPIFGEIPLSITTFGDMDVDAPFDRVFVSGGPEGDTVQAVNFRTEHTETIPGVPGAGGMVLTEDHLYVLLGSGRIDVFDRETLEPAGQFPVPAPATPNHLALAEGRLWFGTGDCDVKRGTITSFDLATHAIETSAPAEALHCTAVVADDAVPGALFTWEADFESPNLTRWDVSRGRFDGVASQVMTYPPGDFAFTPDGARVFVVQGRDGVVAHNADDLLPLWAVGPTPATAVATSADGKTFAIGSPRQDEPIDGAVGLAQDVFGGSLAPLRLWGDEGAGDSSLKVLPRGLALTNPPVVFGVLRSDAGDQTLRYVEPERPPSREATDLTLTLLSPTRAGKTRASAETLGNAETWVEFFATSRARGLRSVDSGFVNGNVATTRFDARSGESVFAAVEQNDMQRPSSSNVERIFADPDVILYTYGGRLSGRTVVYSPGTTPVLQGSVQPARSGDPLVFLTQLKRGNAWVRESRQTFTTDARGLVDVRFVGGKEGTTYRTRVIYGRHDSSWRYFEFRGAGTASAAKDPSNAQGSSLSGRGAR